MIHHDEEFDRANLVLTLEVERGLQGLFEYIIYLGIKVIRYLINFDVLPFGYSSQMKFFLISFVRLVCIPIPV